MNEISKEMQELILKHMERAPSEFKSMTKEELVLIVHGLSCKVEIIEHSWKFRKNKNKDIIDKSEVPCLSRLFNALDEYEMLTSFDDLRKKEENRKNKLRTNQGHVYVIEFSDLSIKIGMSKTPEDRVVSIAQGNQSTLVRYWVSERSKEYKKIERIAHRHFKEHRIGGEFFIIEYDAAVSYISTQVKEYEIIHSS